MKKNYLRAIVICLTMSLLLGEPLMVYAVNVDTDASAENIEDNGERTSVTPIEEEDETNNFAQEENVNEIETPIKEADEDETEPPTEEEGKGETEPPTGEDGEGEIEPPTEEEGKGETEPPTEEDGEGETETPIEDDESKNVNKEDELTEEEKLKLLEADRLIENAIYLDEPMTAKSGVWNIIDFGAVSGNDSTYAINQALSNVTSEASTVLIPSGTYNLVGWLKVPSNANIVFEEGAVLNGDGACGGFLIQGEHNIRIENPTIKNVSIGIKAESGASSIHITGGKIQPISSGAGVETNSVSSVTIKGVSITDSKLGVFSSGGGRIEVIESIIMNQSQGGIWVEGGTASLKNNTIKKCKISGIWIDKCSGSSISSNTLEENGDSSVQSTYGIKINASSDIIINDNDILNGKKQGINIDSGSTKITVNSNRILCNGAIGVCVGNGSSLSITSNIIKQNQDHGIILMNSYGIIKDNIIDGLNSVGTVDRANHYGIIIFCRNINDKNSLIEVSNNKISGMIGNGIQVTGDKANPTQEGAVNVLVSANQVSNVGDNGITVNYNSHNVAITGNLVNNTGVNGIDVQGGSKNCKVDYNTVNNAGYMGISIGSGSTGAGVDIIGNKVDASKNVGIHVNNGASTVTISENTISNHSGNFSIAVVNGAKSTIKQNTVIFPMDYISKYTNIVQYAIFVGDGTTTTNGAVKFNFKPDIPAVGATKVTGSGIPGFSAILNLNGTKKSATINSQWKYSIACDALKASDNYQISVNDSYNNTITYTNGTISNDVDETKIRAFVERMYTVALNRPSDKPGCDYWTQQLISGAKDGATVAKGFILSGEMELRKLNNEQFVNMLYRTFFDREPAANDSGKAFWINLLENGVSRAYVFRGFCHSGEFTNICNNYGITRGSITLAENRDQKHDVTMYVYRCYNRTLGRTPDVKGLNYWTGQIIQKTRTPSEVAANFVFSKEFINKKLSDEEYIKVMYRMFFDREYDNAGLKFWLNELKTGNRDRYKVFTGFANSKEFKIVLQKFGL